MEYVTQTYTVLGIGFVIIGLAGYGLYDISAKVIWRLRLRLKK